MRKAREAPTADREYLPEPPSIITITVWMDRDPEIESPLPAWLTEAALIKAAEIIYEEAHPDPEQEEE